MIIECEICNRNNIIGTEGRCAHVDCPYRPVAWSDGVPTQPNDVFDIESDLPLDNIFTQATKE